MQISSDKIYRSWGCNVQNGDYSWQCCIVNLKIANSIHLKSVHLRQKKKLTLWWWMSTKLYMAIILWWQWYMQWHRSLGCVLKIIQCYMWILSNDSVVQSSPATWRPRFKSQSLEPQHPLWALQVVLGVKNLPANARDVRDMGLIPGSGKFPGRENAPTPVFLPEKSHGQKRLASYSPWDHKKSSDRTEHAHT